MDRDRLCQSWFFCLSKVIRLLSCSCSVVNSGWFLHNWVVILDWPWEVTVTSIHSSTISQNPHFWFPKIHHPMFWDMFFAYAVSPTVITFFHDPFYSTSLILKTIPLPKLAGDIFSFRRSIPPLYLQCGLLWNLTNDIVCTCLHSTIRSWLVLLKGKMLVFVNLITLWGTKDGAWASRKGLLLHQGV